MVIRRSQDRNKEGVLTLVDALIFIFILFIVSIFVLSFLHTGFLQTSDVRRSKFRREAVIDIQETSLNSIIRETGYINESADMDRVTYRNITIETAILNYLYLKDSEKGNDALAYNLSGLKEDIEQRYKKCVWEISHYHFALETAYDSSELFISDVEGVSAEEKLPAERSATSTFTTLGLEQVQISLYIWR